LDCDPCIREFQADRIRPTVDTYNKYLQFFLQDLPDENCAKAGQAAYAGAVNYLLDANSEISVQDSYFMGYHTTCIRSIDFYTAMAQARLIADDIAEMFERAGKEVTVFPYRFVLIGVAGF
jgi:Niemann-Pick C1 protein